MNECKCKEENIYFDHRGKVWVTLPNKDQLNALAVDCKLRFL